MTPDNRRKVPNIRLEDGEKIDNLPDDTSASISDVQNNLNEHEADTSNPHSVTKAQVGLPEVDNTSDVNKPISNATQIALNNKFDKTGGDIEGNVGIEGSVNIENEGEALSLIGTTGIYTALYKDGPTGGRSGLVGYTGGGSDTLTILNEKIDGNINLDTQGAGVVTSNGNRVLDINDVGSNVQAYNSVLDTTTASFTTDDESKLDGIETGAESNTVDSVNSQTGAVILDADDISDTSTTNKFVQQDVVTTLGADDTTIPTSKAVSDAIGVAGGGDMLKATYDTDNSGVVDEAEVITNQGALATLNTVGTTEINDNAVTFDKIEDVPTNRVLARSTSGTGSIEALTIPNFRTLINVEDGADVTDTANVTSAGALMDSEVTNLAQVKAFNSSDYATALQGTKADTSLQPATIGVTVQPYDSDTTKNDVANTFTTYQVIQGVIYGKDAIFSQGVASATTGSNACAFKSQNTASGAIWSRRITDTNDVVDEYFNGATHSEKVRLTSTGNLGLNTTTAKEKVEIVGGSISIDAFSTEGTGLFFRKEFSPNGTNSSDKYNMSITSKDFEAGNADGGVVSFYDGIALHTGSSTYSASKIGLFVNSNQNVSINAGVTNLGSKLGVVGLPTSSVGLSTGAFWNSSGTVKVV